MMAERRIVPNSMQYASPLDAMSRNNQQQAGLFRFPDSSRTPTHRQQPPQSLHPTSPILHSHFARGSTATASTQDTNSFMDLNRDSVDSQNMYQGMSYGYYDSQSVDSSNLSSPALRDSWESTNTARVHLNGPEPPAVYVSEWTVNADSEPQQQQFAGKAAILKPTTSNFSRPVRPPRPSAETMYFAEDLDEHKRIVLERNARRPETPTQGSYVVDLNEDPPSPSQLAAQSPRGRALSNPSSPSIQTPMTTSGSTMGRSVTLSRKPPSLRAASPASSIYSNYSFYQMDSSTPSPTGSTHFLRDSPTGSNQNLDSASGSRARTPLSNEPKRRVAFQTPSTSPSSETGTAQSAQEYLQLGITHHEANRLRESAICFERSAVVGGGCGVGMLMYGLTLRHGWGCEKNEKTGFKWLRKAAEAAVDDLESARNGGSIVGEGSEKLKTGDEAAVQNELILAIYEVGQCFFHGWGVAKDQKMGVSYYQVAARLGDADAQCDLAFCLANGKGCKKDRKTAAKWYRAAVAQGQSDIGLAWIYKEKFQD